MKKLLMLLALSSQLLYGQNNVAFLGLETPITDNNTIVVGEFSTSYFDLIGGLVIVQASINGEMGDFILDTGAPGIVINSKSDDFKSSQMASGVGGQVEVGEVELNNFNWGIIHKQKLNGYVLDVSHLENACGRDIMGLIGYEVFQNYELLFDYKNQQVRILNIQDADNQRFAKKCQVIPFTMYNHVPVVVAKVGGKRALLGLDSGAEVNLLDQSYFEKINPDYMSAALEENLTGLENKTTMVMGATLNSTNIKGIEFSAMRYLFTDVKAMQTGNDVVLDGILGYPFFKDQLISINYKQRKIYIWDGQD